MADVRRDRADLVLLFCYLITGLLDSASISIWGSFVSMQTGNTVYIGLGLAAPNESVRWIKALTSLAFFCFGSFIFSRAHNFLGPRKRWVLVTSLTIQFLFIVGAALIVMTQSFHTSIEGLHWADIVPIAFVAFQSAGQAVLSRIFKFNALTSLVLTSNYCDLFIDKNLFKLRNTERNQRVAAPILLLAGAISGGVLAHSSAGIAGALWTAAGLKFLIIVAWAIWPEDGTAATVTT